MVGEVKVWPQAEQQGSGSGSAAGKTAQLLSGLVLAVDRLNEEVKRGQVCSGLSRRGLVESSCRHNGAAVVVLFRFDFFEVRIIRSVYRSL